MFQFRRFPSYAYLIQRRMTVYCTAGFPHSEISGSKAVCASPKLIAACHVLHRLLMPRHSPCALISLTFVGTSFVSLASTSRSKLVHAAVPPPPRKPTCVGLRSDLWFSRIMQASEFIGYIVLPFSKFHNLRLPSVACFAYFQSALFSFQGAASGLFQDQIEIPNLSDTSIQF